MFNVQCCSSVVDRRIEWDLCWVHEMNEWSVCLFGFAIAIVIGFTKCFNYSALCTMLRYHIDLQRFQSTGFTKCPTARHERKKNGVCLKNKTEHQFYFETEQPTKDPLNIASVLSDFVSALLFQFFFLCCDKNVYFRFGSHRAIWKMKTMHKISFSKINKSLLLVSST